MGTYIPSDPQRKRSMTDTLLEAEQEHYLDCPNADLPIRCAAFFLDIIFCSLASSAIHHFNDAVFFPILAFASDHIRSQMQGQIPGALNYLEWVLKISLIYMYFFWTLIRFGGSPAKLLLGLRVLDEQTGERLSFPRVILREIVLKVPGLLLGLSWLVAIFRKDRRSFHDLLSRSVVKWVRSGP